MKNLKFSSENEALQYFADVTGKNIKIAGIDQTTITHLENCLNNLDESTKNINLGVSLVTYAISHLEDIQDIEGMQEYINNLDIITQQLDSKVSVINTIKKKLEESLLKLEE